MFESHPRGTSQATPVRLNTLVRYRPLASSPIDDTPGVVNGNAGARPEQVECARDASSTNHIIAFPDRNDGELMPGTQCRAPHTTHDLLSSKLVPAETAQPTRPPTAPFVGDQCGA